MKLVLHIVEKDLARLRWWLVAWLGVLMLPVLFGFDVLICGPFGDNGSEIERMSMMLLGLEGLMAYVLTILLIQEDAIVGTRQFWLTRPITSGQLLVAKTLGAVAIFGAMPVFVSLPWWWWCGFGLREMSIAALESCALAALIVVPAALVAVLTDSLARALLWTMVLLAAVPVTMVFFTSAMKEAMAPTDLPGLIVSRAVLAVAAVAVEFALVVVAQFFLRWRGRWLAVAGFVVVATVTIASAWPWTIIGRSEPREVNAERASGVTVRFEQAAAGALGGTIGEATKLRERELRAEFVASGTGSDDEISAVGAEQHWRDANGRTLNSRGFLDGNYFGLPGVAGLHRPTRDEETERWWSDYAKQQQRDGRVGVPVRLNWPADEFPMSARARLWASQIERMRREPPAYEARLWLELVRADVVFEVPLEAGRWKRGGGRGLRIENVTRGSNGVVLRLVDTQPDFFCDRVRVEAAKGRWFVDATLWERTAWVGVAVNRARGEFVEFWDRPQETRSVVVNGVRINWRRPVTVSGPRRVRDGKWQSVPGWMDGVTIGLVTLRSEAVFARDVKVPRFSVEETATAPSP
ncbi:MAG TPA: hypothetical protein VHD62_09270 [Opitutaceae bacterium]|nr:hypothetical protein [Opitutaceae bacterium]